MTDKDRPPESDPPGEGGLTRTTEPVPLFLIPHTLAEEIRTYGRAIETMDIVRAHGNRFRIVVTLRAGTPVGYGS